MEKKELLPYKPGVILQGTYKSYGSRFGFLLTDEDHEDVYIADKDHPEEPFFALLSVKASS